MQYRNKIIAFFTTVCLLVTLLIVPVGAVQIESYNMYDLSGYIEYVFCDDTITFDSGEFPLSYTHTYVLNNTGGNGLTGGGFNPVFRCSIPAGKFIVIDFHFPSVDSVYGGVPADPSYFGIRLTDSTDAINSYRSYCQYYLDGRDNPFTLSRDTIFGDPILDSDATASLLVDPNGSITGIRLAGTTIFDVFYLRPYWSYDFDSMIPNGTEVVSTFSFSTYNDFKISVFGSADEAEEALGSTSNQNPSLGGGSCACPSILNSVLSAITAQTNFLSTWQQTWTTRMDGLDTLLGHFYPKLHQIETNTSQLTTLLTPSGEETALKSATSDVTAAFTEQFWGENSDNAFDGASVTESADILNETKQLFNTGVSTSDFFSLFGDSSWGHWFSAETRDDLDTVPSVSALDLYEDEEKSAYEKNLDAIRDFMGG